jgi:hypothetical protein
MHNSALAAGLVSEQDVALFMLTDSIEEAFAILKSCHKRKQFVITPP